MLECELDDGTIQALSEIAEKNSDYQFDSLDLMYEGFIGQGYIKA